MNVYVTSDTHFGHKNILQYNSDTRPWDTVEEMDDGLIKAWNAYVGNDDIVYHLGDFAFCGFQRAMEIANQLNGRIVLIRGNHDQMFRKEQNIQKALATGKFSKIVDYVEYKNRITESGHPEIVVMFHYAMRVWNRSHHGSFMLYGHSHGSLPGVGRSVDVGIDSKEIESACGPVRLNAVLDMLREKEPMIVDHHNEETR